MRPKSAAVAVAVVLLAGLGSASARVPETVDGRTSVTQSRPQLYSFYPQAGILWQDLFVNNFVDLDPSPGVREWACSAYSYDGHRGHDTDIRSFREQEIGVPVFAALDGTVVSAVDGHPDQSTSASGGPSNLVLLDHGGGHRTAYFHLKRGSVAVSAGARVRAGAQIGLTGSSGNSTWPHLHFESTLDGVAFEPSAGDCRPGPSGWREQTPIRRETYVRGVAVSPARFDGRAGLPFDEAQRTGTFVAGRRTVAFRVELANQPAQASYRLRILRPDGGVSVDFPSRFDTPFLRQGWWWWSFDVDLVAAGDWRVELDVEGRRMVEAPFRVVASANEIVNRPPGLISVAVRPLGASGDDPVLCLVSSPVAIRDPDYDIIRFAYRWTLDGRPLREVTSAALSDMIPAGAAAAGGSVGCSVTPSDSQTSGSTASATSSIAAAPTSKACVVPRVRGRRLSTARRLIASGGCRLGVVRRVFAQRVAKGVVVSQRPGPRTRLVKGARVHLVVSRGRR